MPDLIYYTVGHSPAYIEVLRLSIESLRRSGWAGDVAVICDESFLETSKQRFGDGVQYLAVPDSLTPEQASINKLRIFELPTIDQYDRVLFLDSDILVHMNVQDIVSKIVRDGILYVYTETQKHIDHLSLMWSLKSYTDTDLERFRTNSVYVFNAGCFAFVRSDAMKQHFLAIQYMIMTHTGPFFYEQSFMNVYFNRNGQTDRTLLTNDNYAFPPKHGVGYPGHLVHFAGDPGRGGNKYQRMKSYIDTYLRS